MGLPLLLGFWSDLFNLKRFRLPIISVLQEALERVS